MDLAGTFTVTLDGYTLGTDSDVPETTAQVLVKFQDRKFVLDDDTGKVVFPHKSHRKALPVSLPYNLELVTDVAAGAGSNSTDLGYEVTVLVGQGKHTSTIGTATFAARPADSTWDFTDLLSDVPLPPVDDLSALDTSVAYQMTTPSSAIHAVLATYATGAEVRADPKYPLAIPTPDGNPHSAHPSVVDMHGLWNGYRYWMAFTPFPAEIRENPCIVASNNKVDWVVPEGLTNPVTTVASIQAQGWDYNSDSELVYDANLGALVLYERVVKSTLEAVRRRTSTDGVIWTAPVEVLTAAPDGSANRKLVSQTVVIEADGTYKMWVVNRQGANSGLMVDRRTSADGITWSAATTCTIPTSAATGEVNPWHMYVTKAAGRYHMLMSTQYPSRALLYWTSLDGQTWTVGGPIVQRSGRAEDAGGFYRSCFVARPGPVLRFDVYATIISREDAVTENNNHWRIALLENVDLTEGVKRGKAPILALPAMSFGAGLNTPVQSFVNARWPAWLLPDGTDKGIATVVPIRGHQRVRVKVVWVNTTTATGNVGFMVQTHQYDQADGAGSSINGADVTAAALGQYVNNVTDLGEIPIRPGNDGLGVSSVNLRIHRRATLPADTLTSDIAVLAVIVEQP